MQDTFSSDAIGPTPIKLFIDPTLVDSTIESNEPKVIVGSQQAFFASDVPDDEI